MCVGDGKGKTVHARERSAGSTTWSDDQGEGREQIARLERIDGATIVTRNGGLTFFLFSCGRYNNGMFLATIFAIRHS
jgi:hypothetical protein